MNTDKWVKKKCYIHVLSARKRWYMMQSNVHCAKNGLIKFALAQAKQN